MSSAILKLKTCLVALFIVGMPTSVCAQVIYGLKNTVHFNTSKQGPFFVQVESFRSKSLAQKLKVTLAKRIHYPVQVQLVRQKYYTVRIGPLLSIDAVHSLNAGISSIPTQPPSKKQTANTISKAAHRGVKLSNVKHADSQSVPLSSSSTSGGSSVSLGHPHQWYVGMNVGFMQTSYGKKVMTVPNGSGFPPPADVDEFSLSQNQPVMLDVQVGHRWYRDTKWLPSYALAVRYEHVFSENIHGTITQYSLPETRNYSYNWGVEADAVSVYSKIDLVRVGRFMPYFDVGIGASFNRALHFSEKTLPGVMSPRISPDFAQRTSSQFTYNVGAGLDYTLTRNFMLSVGYDYQSFGNISSGHGQGADWYKTKLSLGKFNTNMGLVGITYLFDNSMPLSQAGFK